MIDLTEARAIAQAAIEDHGALQTETELALLLLTIEANGGGVMCEIGTWAGGLTWALCQLPETVHIFTIDPTPRPEWASMYRQLERDVTWLHCDSTHPDTVARLTADLDGAPLDVLIIDGAHDLKSATSDWERYRPLVGDGGLIVVHDTQGYPCDQPVIMDVPELWAKIRADWPTTELISKPGGPGGTGIVWVP